MDMEHAQQEFRSQQHTALVLGHTGAIGKLLVEELVNSAIFSKIVLIGRREISIKEGDKYKCIEQRVVDFDKLEEHSEAFSGCHVGYCCIGSQRAQVGKEQFVKVDRDLCVNAARVAREQGVKQYHLLSSQAADPNSKFLYPRTKGEAERDIKALGFERMYIYRPGYLKVKRDDSRFCGLLCACCCGPLMWCMPTLMSVSGDILTAAMLTKTVTTGGDAGSQWECLENADIHRVGDP